MALGNYIDHPDGKACFQKMAVISKYTGVIGFTYGTFDVMMKTKPDGYVKTAAVYMRSTLPMMGAGLAFVAISCSATNLRGKDDKINYLLGGAAAGGVFGAVARSFMVGMPTAFFLACAAALYKDSKDEGWEMFPHPPHGMGLMDYRQGDFTITKERR